MTKITKKKAKSGGKSKAKATNQPGFLLPKKVRTEISIFRENLEVSNSDNNSKLSFVSSTVSDSELVQSEIIASTYSIARLSGTCRIKRNDVDDAPKAERRFGNALFWQWSDEAFKWPRCQSWTSHLLNYGKEKMSWEAAFTQLFADHKRDWNYLERLVRTSLDRSLLDYSEEPEEHFYWVVRIMAIGVVQCCPTDLFDIGAPTQHGQSRYWDKSNPTNPRILVGSRPFAKFWALCCEIFNFPWADPTITRIPPLALSLQTAARSCLAQRERACYRRSLARQRGLPQALFRRSAPPCSRLTRTST